MPRCITAHHRIITDACRDKGDETATDEAMATARDNVLGLLRHWAHGSGAQVHIKVEVEYPDRQE